MFIEAERRVGFRPLTTTAVMPLLSGALVLCLFLRLMNFEPRRDEQLYVPPTRLLDDQTLYGDFFYNHTPGSAWLFHAVRRLLGSDHLLFDARLGVFAGWLLLIAGIAVLSYALTRSLWISWSIVVVSLCNELLLSQTGMTATNNLLPLPFSLLGLGLFVLAVSSTPARSGMAAFAGVCLSLATVFKISGVAFILPVAIASLLLPRAIALPERLKRVTLPLAAGGIVGAVPVLYYLASDPVRFIAHVLGYHLGPHAQYWLSAGAPDEGAVTSTLDKLLFAHDIWIGGVNGVALVALMLLAIVRWHDPRGRRSGSGAGLMLVACAFCVSAVLSLMPTPSFPQYFAPLFVCLPLALALLAAELSPEGRDRAAAVLLAASAVAFLAQAPRLVQHVGTLVRPDRWAVAKVHAAGDDIAQRLRDAGLQGRVATLAPLYPLEGGLPVYPELATGIFAYRTAAITPPTLAKYYRMVSPAGIPAILDAEPPAAFLLGFEQTLEKPFLDYALSHGYRPVPDFDLRDRYGTGLLYLKPGA
ncbi:hypothetical protein Sa4125_04860 [Aureimonas sp. SA4125]|uniref:hypothetical protein n=1 Tax=Aureimonas sp. SA4125 TaxID=2826993 RepID=UPI001CC383C5|nr:hypothetical protein [Aureimonas sp. SA4125]BDA82944.1 hypothetical protein Sa4125_04860 [Aureimonas sp. SA4125]